VAAWSADTLLFLISHYVQLTRTDPATTLLAGRLAWTSAIAIILLAIGLGHALAGRPLPGRVLVPIAAINTGLLGLLWFTEALVSRQTYVRVDLLGFRYPAPVPGPLLPLLVPYIVAAFVYGYRALRTGTLEAGERRLIRIGFGVYVLAGLNDALHSARLLQSVRIFDFAFVAVAMSLTYLVVRRHHRLHTHLEEVVSVRTSALQGQQEELRQSNLALDAALAEARRANDAAYQQGQRLAALLRTSQSVLAGLDLEATLGKIIEEAARIARTPHVKLLLVDREAGVLRMGAVAGGSVPAGFEVPIGKSYSGRVAATGEPLFVGDTQNDPENLLAQRDRDEGLRTYLGLPIKTRDRVLGVLTFNTERAYEYGPPELAYLSSFADVAAIAIDNARLYGEAQRRERRLVDLAALTATLTSTLSLDEVLDRVARRSVELFGSSVARLWLLEPDGATITLRAHAGATSTVPGVTRMGAGEGVMGRIVTTRAPLVIEDLAQFGDAKNAERHRAEGVVSFAGAPLLSGDQVLGAIGIALRERRRFADEELSMLQSLANHAAIAIEDARLYRELAERGNRLATMVQVARRLTAGLELPAVLQSIATAAAETFGGEAGLRIVEGDELVRVAATAGAVEVMAQVRLRMGESISGRVAATGEPIVTADIESDPTVILPHRRGSSRPDRTGSLMCVPVRAGGRILGTLNVYGPLGHGFHDEAVALAMSLADQAGIAIENARLYESAEAQARELTALHEVRTALTSTLHLHEVLKAIGDWAVKLIGAQGSGVFDFDPRDGLLHLRTVEGTGSQVPFPLKVGQGGPGMAVLTKKPVWSADVQGRPFPGYTDEAPGQGRSIADDVRELPYRALLAVPILRHGDVLGAISLTWSEVHTPSEREIRLLTAFAEHAAVALDNARLYDRLEARLRGLETLTRLNRLISSSLDSKQVLKEIMRSAAQLMDVPVATFWLADESTRTLDLVGLSDPTLDADYPTRSVSFDQGLVGWIATHRRSLQIADVRADTRIAPVSGWALGHGLTSFYGVPVLHEGALLAVLGLIGRQPFQLGPEEESLLQGFVAQAAVTIRNVSLYEAEGAARREAELALAQVKQLQGMLPICAYCKKIRNDRNYWESIEGYIGERSQATFSHGICPDCREQIVAPQLEEFKRRRSTGP
jgi:GAF domain-containing protein